MPSECQGSRWPGSTAACPSLLAAALRCPGPAGARTSRLQLGEQVDSHALPELPAGCHVADLWPLGMPAAHGEACSASDPREDADSGVILNEPACLSIHACVHTPTGLRRVLGRQGSTQGPGTFPGFLELCSRFSSLDNFF